MSGGAKQEQRDRGAEAPRAVGAPPPVPALLRRPSVVVRQALLTALRDAGYDDVLPAHLAVLQHPGPEGRRPGWLAARNRASKQAMNHLLHQLEDAGYLVREAHPENRRTRVVRLTERGHAAVEVISQTATRLGEAWARAIGPDGYAALHRGLLVLENHLDELA
ncbi:MAG TPA: MarR family transcriptional regulator [Nocardioidaceae bacterium]|nr:MarR family transcriptional regulator [Nocardioidaceae bacterium]